MNNEEHNDTGGAVSLNPSTGEITIDDTAGFSRFRVVGFCTIYSNLNGVYALSFKRNGVAQHDRQFGDMDIDSTGGAAWPLLAFPPFWLPITAGGESIFLEIFTPTSTQIQGAFGIGIQIELK
ncbi:MAG: hypothetical protein N0E58_05060 [Candidatus Thiodiazotropha endolucinida]|uniref:Uncharacterized protein n=1 Tax=Candidatus Thiodiazotropha taylori TaxID=2792791 RepID=A0A9E4NHR3_9GAMM|nr:hypothetical protein [Candidatus Thiodiazotropha taylori]MCW4235618.1 hypothetical protein [Candidatus Thiodiazotropha endolucinida]